MSEHITYFGYGSLVNRRTRPADESAQPATLHGWRRHWGHQSRHHGHYGNSCSLSIREGGQGDRIQGMVVTIPTSALPVLDERESGYDRIMLPAEHFSLPADCTAREVAVYVSSAQRRGDAHEAHPILQTYVDCVMDGFERVFGDTGLADFLHSTDGWHGPIENDRHAPRYPRAVTLHERVLQRFDALLDAARQRAVQALLR